MDAGAVIMRTGPPDAVAEAAASAATDPLPISSSASSSAAPSDRPRPVRQGSEGSTVSEEDSEGEQVRPALSALQRQQIDDLVAAAHVHHRHSEDVRLQGEWCFWIDRNVKKGVSEGSFLDSLHNLGTFGSTHGFSELLLTYAEQLINITQHSDKCNIRLFRKGISPTREDPANVLGGQYVVFLPRDRTGLQQLWLDCMLALCHERLQLKGTVIGLVLGLKRRSDTLAIWTDRGCHPTAYQQQRDHICEALGLPRDSKIKYNNHTQQRSRANSRTGPPTPLPMVSSAGPANPLNPLAQERKMRARAYSQPTKRPPTLGLPESSSWQDPPSSTRPAPPPKRGPTLGLAESTSWQDPPTGARAAPPPRRGPTLGLPESSSWQDPPSSTRTAPPPKRGPTLGLPESSSWHEPSSSARAPSSPRSTRLRSPSSGSWRQPPSDVTRATPPAPTLAPIPQSASPVPPSNEPTRTLPPGRNRGLSVGKASSALPACTQYPLAQRPGARPPARSRAQSTSRLGTGAV